MDPELASQKIRILEGVERDHILPVILYREVGDVAAICSSPDCNHIEPVQRADERCVRCDFEMYDRAKLDTVLLRNGAA